MTVSAPLKDISGRIGEKFPGSIVETSADSLVIKAESLRDVADYLKTVEKFDYFNFITAVDYYSYFEIVYRLTSMGLNQSIVIKTRCHDREAPAVPSVTDIWMGADFQEREIFDLFGIRFEGHYNLKRIFLWDGFQGYPLRKDYLQ